MYLEVCLHSILDSLEAMLLPSLLQAPRAHLLVLLEPVLRPQDLLRHRLRDLLRHRLRDLLRHRLRDLPALVLLRRVLLLPARLLLQP